VAPLASSFAHGADQGQPSAQEFLVPQRFARHASPPTTTAYAHPSDGELRELVRGLKCVPRKSNEPDPVPKIGAGRGAGSVWAVPAERPLSCLAESTTRVLISVASLPQSSLLASIAGICCLARSPVPHDCRGRDRQ